MSIKNHTVLMFGANGMLDNTLLRLFSASFGYQVFGAARSSAALKHLQSDLHPFVIADVDVENNDSLTPLFAEVQQNVVSTAWVWPTNWLGGDDQLAAIAIDAQLPHRLALPRKRAGARVC